MLNISSRSLIGADDAALSIGLVAADTESKRFLARAVGPGLAAFGTTGTLGEPRISFHRGDGSEIQRNIGWQTHPDPVQLRDAAQAVGAFQLADGSADSAVIVEVGAGSYVVEVASSSNHPGIGLAELYELDSNGRIANLSVRGRVSAGNPLVGGFVIQGSARKRVLIRAVGATLGELGIPNTLADPVLTIFSGASPIATNDRWSEGEQASAVEAARRHVGAFALPPESEDAAVLLTLGPGAYTIEVKGKEEAEGVVLLELHELL
jgi:hypothetical protein